MRSTVRWGKAWDQSAPISRNLFLHHRWSLKSCPEILPRCVSIRLLIGSNVFWTFLDQKSSALFDFTCFQNGHRVLKLSLLIITERQFDARLFFYIQIATTLIWRHCSSPRRFESPQTESNAGKYPNFEALGFSSSKGLRSLVTLGFEGQKSFLTSYSGPSDGIWTHGLLVPNPQEGISKNNS